MSNRIQTTHVGSLPRPVELIGPIVAKDRGAPYDEDELRRLVASAVNAVVEAQVESGVDVVSDGEMSKPSYTNYLKDRLNGFGDGDTQLMVPLDLEQSPAFMAMMAKNAENNPLTPPACTAPISAKDLTPLESDIDNFRVAINKHGPGGAFMNAATPGVISIFMPNQYYASEDEYVFALADAMQAEYEAIVNAGFRLQLDAPDLAMGRHTYYKNLSDADFRKRAVRNVEALNHATRNIAPEQMRLHLCWGNYPGPHHCDVALDLVLATVMRVRPQTLLFEAANPRHAHEHRVWAERRQDIPDDKILCPGVIDTNTNCIEHPELIAERLDNFANIVGGDRVMAGTDCGFSTVADRLRVFPDFVWRKLQAQREGADLAAARIWR
ncbi:MAG: epoxyalkane--coenzyme M transferase [Gammaproteobacteria bacterium]|nr:epoxyalkane--coenzyme M transferase [Gammaproteobacteria bacterium]